MKEIRKRHFRIDGKCRFLYHKFDTYPLYKRVRQQSTSFTHQITTDKLTTSLSHLFSDRIKRDMYLKCSGEAGLRFPTLTYLDKDKKNHYNPIC